MIFLDVEVPLAMENIRRRKGTRDIHETHETYLLRCRESALYAARRFG